MLAFSTIFGWLIKKRVHQIELFMKFPHEVQRDVLDQLTTQAQHTRFGKRYDFKNVSSVADFKRAVPLQTYDDIKKDVALMMEGEPDVLWPGETKWFAKSSGTTNDRSKLIPVSTDSLEDCHFKGGKDLLGLHVNNHPKSKIYNGKTLVLGGSSQMHEIREDSYTGDLSAIIIKNLPLWVEFRRIPGRDIALHDNWEEKMEKMALSSMNEDVTVISGVPSWTLVLINRILELKGTDNLLDVWPNLELYMHGGVSFEPYRSQYERIIPDKNMQYIQTYNASEGFFGIQDRPGVDDMLLMLDYGIFYEFIPLEEMDKEHPRSVGLDEVEKGKVYELVISTNGGLWRYRIGDTVEFTGVKPYRIKVAGRTKQHINVFGEELMIDNVERGLRIACEKCGAEVADYTVGPIFMENRKNGGHEWLIEFTQQPADINAFGLELDHALRTLNSDYDAKRTKDFNLRSPVIRVMPSGTFYDWMRSRGKLGGQHKVPRLSNTRVHIESILEGTASYASVS
ncbi:MAG: GH3 auxin-responsive promoter family protein [Flavobacteriales bacterium]|nr:GH3 auxin-responsive promoter family protein [Flavobacteriales bacterium]